MLELYDFPNSICEYLNAAFPDPPLAPSDPAERARMRL
jgi:glutathione S-transferase